MLAGLHGARNAQEQSSLVLIVERGLRHLGVRREGEIEASAALGFTAAIAAFALFFIPLVVGIALQATGSPHAAWYVFIAFYLSCVLGTWHWYRRKDSEICCE